MSPAEEADRRIARLEHALARIQHEETTPLQIEAGLRRQALGATLSTAAVMARAVVRVLASAADDFERTHEQMAEDLNRGR